VSTADPSESGEPDRPRQPVPAGASSPATGGERTSVGDPTSPFRPESRKPLVQRVFPVVSNLDGYPRRSLKKDLLVAGITVAALALPSGMAYAQIAGLSPVAGLYGLLLPVAAYVLFGSSRQLIVGPLNDMSRWTGTTSRPLGHTRIAEGAIDR
jgi:sulfate permease, SulP family